MKREEVLQLLAEFKAKIDGTDCGAILIIAARPGGRTDIDVTSNLDRGDQLKVYQAMIDRLRGAQ